MSCSRSPRRRAVVGLVTLPLLAALTVVPARAAEPVRTVRLLPDAAHSDVSAAEVPLAAGSSRLRTSTYSMVAATWRGPAPAVSVRTSPDGSWQRLPELADGPTEGDGEGQPSLGATHLVWTGASRGIDVRVRGGGHRGLELVLIDPGTLPSDDDSDALSDAPSTASVSPRLAAGTAPRPSLLTRRDWGADPDWRNGSPRYFNRLKQVHVHHTATGNGYSRADVPGIIRGMYHYHTQSLGWFDLGYNFIVDRFGRSWVGRSGGANRLVRGAHTLGFNHASVGVAVIGTLEARKPWRRAVSALVRLGAWKLDRHGRDASGTVWVTSSGSDHYPEGERVRLPAVDGHRDTNQTACPGQRLYDRLPGIRRRMQDRIDRWS